MRIHLSLHSLLLLVTASPLLLAAQFQAPTSEELKMNTDPKAPGAAAVFLNMEEITDDPLHYYSFYARIKVLQEKGKALATVEIPGRIGDSGITSVKPRNMGQDWPDNPDSRETAAKSAGKLPAPQGVFKITDIKARTIHPDGTIIPLTLKPDDLLSLNSPSKHGDRITFTLPSVEVGSILEYRYTIHYDENHFSSPFWEVQRPYFVYKAHFAFTPFNDFLNGEQYMTSRYLVDSKGKVVNTIIWSPVLPPDAKVKTDAIGQFSLDLTDIPPVPSEEWMPPVQSLAYHVLFYYKNAFSGTEFWKNESNRWSKEVDRLSEPTGSIRQAVAGLLAPGDSDLEKAARLYKAVQNLDNTDFSPSRQQAELNRPPLRPSRRAEDVWSQRSGSAEDITLLYLAMLRAAGLTAYEMKVVDRDKGAFSSGYLSFDQFNGDLIILNIQGKDIFLDPGQKMCPFQTVHWKHAGASGIRQTPKDPAFANSPLLPYSANTLLRAGDISFDDQSHFTGLFRFVMTGEDALRWRQAALENDQDEVKKQFDSWLESMVPEGVEAHLDHFLALDDPDSNLLAVVNVQGTLGAATSKRLLLPGYFFETRGSHPFVDQEKRLEPVDMHYGDQITDQVVYHLPAGLAVESAPQDTKIPWPEHAVFITRTVSAPGQITIARILSRAFTIAKPEEYQDLRGFYQKVATADQQQLVLTRAPAAKGN
ncbi:MAG: DUF3857 domain-containing protein [Terracidiphilus sp.]